MAGRLNNKVAIITGAASGIGRTTAETFVREGAKVILADINMTGAEKAAAALGASAMAYRLDVTNEQDWQAAVDAAIAQFGKLDIVANVAGIGFPGSIEDVEMKHWDAMIAVNMTGVMLGCKYGIKGIVRSGGSGAILNVSSLGGLLGTADLAGYSATKGAVTLLTKSVALHCAEKRYPIRCVSIHPTYVDSEMLDPVAAAFTSREEMLAGMSKNIPMGRVATPQDIANGMLFVASDEAAMISGSQLIIDGAQMAGMPAAHTK